MLNPCIRSRLADNNKGLQTEELKTYCRERICKKIERLSLTKNQRPTAQEIVSVVTQLRQELYVTHRGNNTMGLIRRHQGKMQVMTKGHQGF